MRSWQLGGAALVGLLVSLASQAAGQPALGPAHSTPSPHGRHAAPLALDQPNIIVVYTEDQRWDSLAHMPAVSRLAAEGVLFTNSFVTTPVCGPSRASLLTGRLASTEGITLNEGASGQFDPSDTIAVKLQQRGYATALYGKYLNGYRDQFPEVPPGWTDWRVFRDGIQDLFSPGSLYLDPVLSWNGQKKRVLGYSTDLLADYAIEFIEQNAEHPFFLLLSFWAPHVPLSFAADRHKGSLTGQAPEKPPSFEEEDMSDKPAWLREEAMTFPNLDRIWYVGWPQYLELLLSVDEALADIRSKLEELGLDQNTILVFTSDNGFLFGEHGHLGKGVPYEESIRVPLVVWNPQIGHRRVDETVLNIDLAPIRYRHRREEPAAVAARDQDTVEALFCGGMAAGLRVTGFLPSVPLGCVQVHRMGLRSSRTVHPPAGPVRGTRFHREPMIGAERPDDRRVLRQNGAGIPGGVPGYAAAIAPEFVNGIGVNFL